MNNVAKQIWGILRKEGMSEVGAAALIGNMQAESALNPINVEDRMHSKLGWTDEQYTKAVDNGTYTKFASDAYGYGLYQLTYGPRKRNYLAFAKARGTSIGDTATQVYFCIKELKEEYSSLWKYLCGTPDLYTATSRICKEFERPAVNNIDGSNGRYAFAQKWYALLKGSAAQVVEEAKNEFWPPRVIALGMSGPDVLVWQALMNARGYECPKTGVFDVATKEVTIDFQKTNSLDTDGIPGPKTWAFGLRI